VLVEEEVMAGQWMGGGRRWQRRAKMVGTRRSQTVTVRQEMRECRAQEGYGARARKVPVMVNEERASGMAAVRQTYAWCRTSVYVAASEEVGAQCDGRICTRGELV